MATLHEFVLETLTHANVQQLNFSYATMRVYPQGYSRDIAHCIRDGLIHVSADPAESGYGVNQSLPAGSFRTTSLPGTPHFLFINPRYVDNANGSIQVRPLSAIEGALLRGTIIHECTHALQDYQRTRLSPRVAEGAAYMAGAITIRLWGYRVHVADPRMGVHACALDIAERFLAQQNQHLRYTIAADDVARLNASVSTAQPSQYVFNGI